jgi:hypothetical protein
MRASGKLFSTLGWRPAFLVAMAVLVLAWGCGGQVTPQAELDDAAKARVQEAKAAAKKFHSQKKADELEATRPRRR